MVENHIQLNAKIANQISEWESNSIGSLISDERKVILSELKDYVVNALSKDKMVYLNFICTHNSRRSQFAQIWAQVTADYFKIPIQSYSGGVEVTALNERAVASLKRTGFDVDVQEENATNPRYQIRFASDGTNLLGFSKLFDDPVNKAERFAAVMTCAHADENCPFVPGTEQRIALRYEDPKAFDDTSLEEAKYDERSYEIGSELFYVFQEVRKSIEARG